MVFHSACFFFVSLFIFSQFFSLASGVLFKKSNFQQKVVHHNDINPGLLNLIVKSYIEDMLSDPVFANEKIKNRLTNLGLVAVVVYFSLIDLILTWFLICSFSNYISTHPALKQKNVYVGQKPPNYDPDYVS